MEDVIRAAVEGDLPQLLELYRPYHQELLGLGMNYDLQEEALPRVLEARIRSRLILAAVAEGEGGVLQGFVFCSILRLSPEYACGGKTSVGFLNDLYVAPDARRRGLARRLTAFAEQWLRDNGMDVMELQYLPGNAAARDYWTGMGMKPVAIVCSKSLT